MGQTLISWYFDELKENPVCVSQPNVIPRAVSRPLSYRPWNHTSSSHKPVSPCFSVTFGQSNWKRIFFPRAESEGIWLQICQVNGVTAHGGNCGSVWEHGNTSIRTVARIRCMVTFFVLVSFYEVEPNGQVSNNGQANPRPPRAESHMAGLPRCPSLCQFACSMEDSAFLWHLRSPTQRAWFADIP